MAYDPYISRIVAMDQVIKDYKSDFDMVKAAEMNYERMRTLNNTTLLQIDIQKSATNILKSLSLDSIWNNPKEAAIDAALAEARSGILSRAVGPLEELPFSMYSDDSVRRKNVLTHTQIRPEQRLVAKLVQMKGNKWSPAREYSEGTALTDDRTIPNVVRNQRHSVGGFEYYTQGSDRKDNLFATDQGKADTKGLASFVNPLGLIAPVGSDGAISNKWLPSEYGQEYNRGWVLNNRPPASEFFTFSIINMARNPNERIYFPAHIAALNEAVSTSWNNISLINRSEDIYIYQRAERSFNLEFWVFATNNDNAANPYNENSQTPFPSFISVGGEDVGVMSKEMMWHKLNFLHQCTRPSYTSNGSFDKAPYCKLTIGGLYKDIHAVIDSVNFAYDQPLIWDVNVDPNQRQEDGVRPMIVAVTLSGKFIHNTSPDSNSKFFGVMTNE